MGSSAGAALVHAAAAGTHGGDDTLVTLFSVVAVVQLVLAAGVVASRTTVSLALLAMGNGVAAGAWVLSRTSGVPWIDSLGAVEPVGTQDLFAAGLGGVSALAALVALAPWRATVGVVGPSSWLAVGACLGLAVPGVMAPHTHSASHQHDHDNGTAVAEATVHTHEDQTAGPVEVAAAADPAASTTAGHAHDPADDHAEAAGVIAHAATGPVISLADVRLSDDQRRAAQQLIDRTTGAMARFTDEASITAAGYTSIGDGLVSEFEHFVNYPMLVDGRELDPGAIESIVMRIAPDGTKRIASAMYILESGSTMAEVPEIAGELTTWHDHQDLCWDPTGTKLLGTLVNGRCTPGGEFRPTAPMLHVWLEEHPCGPFAGIDGHGDCGSHDH